ncbi:UNVERIFIED_CONTAM: Retrovirus-related Pol polyprotein from transposon gypsy [Sesamum radiatum]|uniref:Retrovirus-related Pol polyprotein from transposon gypsy n=1 Tax=Sesamum radiatum TaxID=300843 RepID=A0AAW2S164_SESRA
MDPKKVQAIEEWQPPSDVHDLHSFLGLANYYRRFVKSYSRIARPMTDLLKNTETWNRTPPMPRILRQIEESNCDRSYVGHTRYVETLRGGIPSALCACYIGPLPIMKRIRMVAYRIELPSWWKIYNVFHVSQLKKFSADRENDTRNEPNRPQLELTKTKENVDEAILNHRVTRTAKRKHTEYLVKWKGCSSEENTWERVTNLKAFLPLVECQGRHHLRSGRMSRAARTLGTFDAHLTA